MLRICKYNQEVELFLLECYKKSVSSGLCIENRLENPTPKQIQIFQDTFFEQQPENSVLYGQLKKWIPSVPDSVLVKIADSFKEQFVFLKNRGKNDNVLKNIYIKFMCWIRFTFENLLKTVSADPMTVLYLGETITLYELIFLSIIENCGCTVVLALTSENSEQMYRTADPDNKLSREFLYQKETLAFKYDFTFSYLQKLSEDANRQKKLDMTTATNTWMLVPETEQVMTPYSKRGSKTECLYNMFLMVKGVQNTHNYQAELFQFKKNIEQAGRTVQVEHMILPPDTVETASVIRKNTYDNVEEMLHHMAEENFVYSRDKLTERIRMAFKSVLLDEAKNETRMNRMQNLAVYQVCCLKRYEHLFVNWDEKQDLSVLIGFSSFINKKEQVLLDILSRLPLDIICIYPDKTEYPDITYRYSLEIEKPYSVPDAVFPENISDMQFSTVAYGAEQELNSLLYDGNCGMYRPMQYQKLKSVLMRTTLEEIEIFWKEEPKYRPGFQTVEDSVILPVLFAKVNGVKDDMLPEKVTRIDRSKYGKWIKELLKQERTLLIRESVYPMGDRWVWEQNRPQRMYDVLPQEVKNTWELLQAKLHLFWKNEQFDRKRLMTHPIFKYQHLRQELQETILDKTEQLIRNRWIKSQNESEYVLEILSVLLNIPENILQLLHGFDFTGSNPKLLYWIPDEQKMTRADSILVAFLHLCGFDILFLVPTGYQTVETYYAQKIWEDYQVGKYRMNLQFDGKTSVMDFLRGF